jgi:hypothetical protein
MHAVSTPFLYIFAAKFKQLGRDIAAMVTRCADNAVSSSCLQLLSPKGLPGLRIAHLD